MHVTYNSLNTHGCRWRYTLRKLPSTRVTPLPMIMLKHLQFVLIGYEPPKRYVCKNKSQTLRYETDSAERNPTPNNWTGHNTRWNYYHRRLDWTRTHAEHNNRFSMVPGPHQSDEGYLNATRYCTITQALDLSGIIVGCTVNLYRAIIF